MRSNILKYFSFLFTLTLLSCGGGGGDDGGGNTGGGGGGGDGDNLGAKDGGNGVVVIRYTVT